MISVARLKNLLHYNPDTGAWNWVVKEGGPTKATQRAEMPHFMDRNIWIFVSGRMYQAQNIAFLYMTGEWPSGEIVFNNGVRHDNRWANLHHVPKGLNNLNRKTLATNTSGHKGVHWHLKLGKWRVRIQNRGKRVSVGCYDTLEEASAAFAKAAEEFSPQSKQIENANGRNPKRLGTLGPNSG